MSEEKPFKLNKKEICITSTQIKQAIDLLVNENEILRDRLYKLEEVIDKIKEIVDKAPCLWYVDEELERIDGTTDLVYEEYTGWKDILELLEEIE